MRSKEHLIVRYGDSKSEYGPGVCVELTGDDVATAISSFIVAHKIYVHGPHTITVNGELCKSGEVYVDPSGYLISDGVKFSGRGPTDE